MQNKIDSIIEYLLPFFVTAGEYALEVQKRIQLQKEKTEFSDPGAQILTDADITIQGFFETVLLARYPELKFYGEEYQHSLNQKYFKHSELEIWLDPIDGTLRYKNCHRLFSIVASFVVSGSYLASIWYMPALKTFSIGSAWSGVKQISADKIDNIQLQAQLALNRSSNKVLTYRPDQALKSKLKNFDVVDLAYYRDAEDPGVFPMAFADFSALIGSAPGLIDFLVAGKFLEWGGGVCTNFQGQLINDVDIYQGPSYAKGVIAASSKKFHDELLEVIANVKL